MLLMQSNKIRVCIRLVSTPARKHSLVDWCRDLLVRASSSYNHFQVSTFPQQGINLKLSSYAEALGLTTSYLIIHTQGVAGYAMIQAYQAREAHRR